MTATKWCWGCQTSKPSEAFSPSIAARSRGGLCRDCARKRSKADYDKDRKTWSTRARENAVRRRAEDPVWFTVLQMYNAAKKRAKKKGLLFTLRHEDIVAVPCCPILGVALVYTAAAAKKQGPRPNSPSLDRVDPKLGYVKGNVMVISYRANQIKNDATPDELFKIAMFTFWN